MPNRVRLLYVWDMAKPEEMPPGALARAVTRAARTAALSTLGAGGWPYGSLVLLAVDPACAPLLLPPCLCPQTHAILKWGWRHAGQQTNQYSRVGRVPIDIPPCSPSPAAPFYTHPASQTTQKELCATCMCLN